jgi:hypothetical protein
MNLPKCNLTTCTLRNNCQRYDAAGSHTPIMPFMPEGVVPEPNKPYTGPLNGCEDYWPVGTGTEFFEGKATKTPMPKVSISDQDLLHKQLILSA